MSIVLSVLLTTALTLVCVVASAAACLALFRLSELLWRRDAGARVVRHAEALLRANAI